VACPVSPGCNSPPLPLLLPVRRAHPSLGSWYAGFLHRLLSFLLFLVLKEAEVFPHWPGAQLPSPELCEPSLLSLAPYSSGTWRCLTRVHSPLSLTVSFSHLGLLQSLPALIAMQGMESPHSAWVCWASALSLHYTPVPQAVLPPEAEASLRHCHPSSVPRLCPRVCVPACTP
jgi:hypothetical protein